MRLEILMPDPTRGGSDVIGLERDPGVGFLFSKPLVDVNLQAERQSSEFGDLLRVL